MTPPRFPIFLPESRAMAVKTVVGWALRGADHVPAKALRLLYYPGRGALLIARPTDHVEVFEDSRRELQALSLVARGLARSSADLLLEHQGEAESERWFDRAVESLWSAERIRAELSKNGLRASESSSENGLRASAEGRAGTGLRALESARSLKEAATRIRAILVSRTLSAMREVGDIVADLRAQSKVSYRALAVETGLGISHTALRNAEKVAAQYSLLPPWVRESLPYSHHVALLPVRDVAAKRLLACRAFDRNVPMALREFQALVVQVGGEAERRPVVPSRTGWLSSLHDLIGAQPRWDEVLGTLSETPIEELAQGVELVGDVLDRLSRVEEELAGELARRKD